MSTRESNVIQVGRGFKLKRSSTPPTEKLLPRLDKVRKTAADSWIASCPAHEDSSPSLSIKQVDDRLLIHCFGGCPPGDVMAAVGLTLADLYDRPLDRHMSPFSRRQRQRYGQAFDALRALRHEALVLLGAAGELACMSSEKYERVALAQERIRAALEICR